MLIFFFEIFFSKKKVVKEYEEYFGIFHIIFYSRKWNLQNKIIIC